MEREGRQILQGSVMWVPGDLREAGTGTVRDKKQGGREESEGIKGARPSEGRRHRQLTCLSKTSYTTCQPLGEQCDLQRESPGEGLNGSGLS